MSCGDSCIQPEGGLGLDGVPRLKLMLTQMQLASAECDDSAASASYCQADFAAPEVTAALFCALCSSLQPLRPSCSTPTS